MNSAFLVESSKELDFVEEIRLRTWARHNYAPQGERSHSWHPIVLDEMRRKDCEQNDSYHTR